MNIRNANIASYNFNHFVHLAQKGSLFCKHIILESRFLTGESSHIAILQNEFQPKINYASDAVAGLSMLNCIARPVSRQNALLYGDILSVCIRNYVIQMAASKQKYIFALHDLADFSQRELKIPSDILIESRKMKERHRSRDSARSADVALVNDMKNCVVDAVHYRIDPIPTSHPVRRISDGYIQLREFEAWYYSNPRIIPDENKEIAGRIIKMVRSPSSYRFAIRNNIAELMEVFLQRQAA